MTMVTGMKRWVFAGAVVLVLATAVVLRPDRALQVASGLTAQMLCSSAFVSELDPEITFDETVKPMTSVAAPLLRYAVDRQAKTVSASVAGFFAAKAAYHQGYGCRLEYADSIPAPPPVEGPPPAAEPPAAEPGDTALRAALDMAFAEKAGETPRNVKAIVILKDGRIAAERYAPGYGPNTPLLSYSVAKSVTSALIGVLAARGKIDVTAPAPIAAWHGPGDPRAAITTDHLLRMASGLDMEENGSGFDEASQMVYAQNDMAAFAEAAALKAQPGTAWSYTSTNTLILARIVRDAIAGDQAAYVRFAREALFKPVGMTHVTMEFDGVGTQEGSASILATARDWARFGQLYLDDGIAPDGTRVLPAGWVDYSKRSTLGTSYGAGFWTNAGRDEPSAARIRMGMPADAYFASGNLGQRIYVVPSERLVMVRFGVTHRPPAFDIAGDIDVMVAAMKALRTTPPR